MTQNAYIDRKKADGSPLPLTAEMNGYLAWLKAKKYSRATIKMRSWQLGWLSSFLAAAGVGQVRETPPVLLTTGFGPHLLAAGLSESSVIHTIQGAKCFFAYLEAEGLLFENPASDLVVPKRPVPPALWLTPEQVEQVISQPDTGTACGLRDRAFLEVLSCTVLPLPQFRRLTIFELDMAEHAVLVKAGTYRKRPIPLSPTAVSATAAYLKSGRPQLLSKRPTEETADIDALWVSRLSQPLSKCQALRIVRIYAQSAGLPKEINTDAFRRSCMKNQVQSGTHPLALVVQLGYNSISALGRFLGISAAELMRSCQEAES